MISSIDHIVLTASDLDKTIAFLLRCLRDDPGRLYPLRWWRSKKILKVGNQKINLHNAKSPFKPHANNPVSGAVDTCFLSSKTMEEWNNILSKNKIEIEDEPVQKTGATGPIMSLYIRDPDLNLIKISNKL